MSDAPSMTRDQISAAIAEKAWRDPAFHKAVLENPNRVFEEQTGQSLPPGMTIKVLEDTPNTVHFVIPAKPDRAGELSDAELETVAGGAPIRVTFASFIPGGGPVSVPTATLSVSATPRPGPSW